jgi:DNA invertase Pin-like site-specific DNA recombinase
VSGNDIARLFLTIVSAFAEFERDRIGERIRATKRAPKARRTGVTTRRPDHRPDPPPLDQSATSARQPTIVDAIVPVGAAFVRSGLG